MQFISGACLIRRQLITEAAAVKVQASANCNKVTALQAHKAPTASKFQQPPSTSHTHTHSPSVHLLSSPLLSFPLHFVSSLNHSHGLISASQRHKTHSRQRPPRRLESRPQSAARAGRRRRIRRLSRRRYPPNCLQASQQAPCANHFQ
jgi:hypothetical protein